jgi:SPP1 family predicted phage head-tail adaptor
MTSGPMRFRFYLQVVTTADDSFSDSTPTWITIGEQWGSIRQLSGREVANADRLKSLATHVVTLRYVTPISAATNRLVSVADGTIYNIETANNTDGRKREYLLTVIEDQSPQ